MGGIGHRRSSEPRTMADDDGRKARRVAVVTGASSGLGRATARLLAK